MKAETHIKGFGVNVKVRGISATDAKDIAILCGELGYPSTAEQCAQRIEALSQRTDQKILAATKDEKIIGFVHVRLNDLLEVDRQAEIAALVVLESHRGQGVGKLLMSAAEEWARGKAEKIVLRSRIHRTEAHKFYQSLGYAIEKTSYTLGKTIN